MNAAALGRDLDEAAGQPEIEAVPENRHAGQLEEKSGADRRAVLQKGFQPMPQKAREGDGKDKQRRRKRDSAHKGFAKKEEANADENEEQGKDINGQVIFDWPRGALRSGPINSQGQQTSGKK